MMLNGSKLTLLCVDDEPAALRVRRMMLEVMGYTILTAGGGDEALELFAQHDVDAVLLDYAMPGKDGATVARAMRSLKPQVPLIMLTAYVSLPEEVMASVDAFVTKGEPTETLLQQIETCLARR